MLKIVTVHCCSNACDCPRCARPASHLTYYAPSWSIRQCFIIFVVLPDVSPKRVQALLCTGTAAVTVLGALSRWRSEISREHITHAELQQPGQWHKSGQDTLFRAGCMWTQHLAYQSLFGSCSTAASNGTLPITQTLLQLSSGIRTGCNNALSSLMSAWLSCRLPNAMGKVTPSIAYACRTPA